MSCIAICTEKLGYSEVLETDGLTLIHPYFLGVDFTFPGPDKSRSARILHYDVSLGRCHASIYGGHFELLDRKTSEILVDTIYNDMHGINLTLDLKVVKTVV